MAITSKTLRYIWSMPEGLTRSGAASARPSKDVQPVDIAPSTCHGRVRRLQDLGVIRGFYTDIDPTAIGLTLQAMISVSLQANARGRIRSFIQQIRRKPQVME